MEQGIIILVVVGCLVVGYRLFEAIVSECRPKPETRDEAAKRAERDRLYDQQMQNLQDIEKRQAEKTELDQKYIDANGYPESKSGDQTDLVPIGWSCNRLARCLTADFSSGGRRFDRARRHLNRLTDVEGCNTYWTTHRCGGNVEVWYQGPGGNAVEGQDTKREVKTN